MSDTKARDAVKVLLSLSSRPAKMPSKLSEIERYRLIPSLVSARVLLVLAMHWLVVWRKLPAHTVVSSQLAFAGDNHEIGVKLLKKAGILSHEGYVKLLATLGVEIDSDDEFTVRSGEAMAATVGV